MYTYTCSGYLYSLLPVILKYIAVHTVVQVHEASHVCVLMSVNGEDREIVRSDFLFSIENPFMIDIDECINTPSHVWTVQKEGNSQKR